MHCGAGLPEPPLTISSPSSSCFLSIQLLGSARPLLSPLGCRLCGAAPPPACAWRQCLAAPHPAGLHLLSPGSLSIPRHLYFPPLPGRWVASSLFGAEMGAERFPLLAEAHPVPSSHAALTHSANPPEPSQCCASFPFGCLQFLCLRLSPPAELATGASSCLLRALDPAPPGEIFGVGRVPGARGRAGLPGGCLGVCSTALPVFKHRVPRPWARSREMEKERFPFRQHSAASFPSSFLNLTEFTR